MARNRCQLSLAEPWAGVPAQAQWTPPHPTEDVQSLARLPTPTVGLAPAATVKGALWPPSEPGAIVLEGLQERTVGDGLWKKVKNKGKSCEERRSLLPWNLVPPSPQA